MQLHQLIIQLHEEFHCLLFVKEGDNIHRFSLCMPSEELAPYYTSYWTDFNNEDQMACLNRLCKEYDPQTIAVNVSNNFCF